MGDVKHKGSCLCGEVSYQVEGEFDSFFLCHCSLCRKDTGSAHAANLFSTSAALEWLSGERHVNTYRLPATRHQRSFCVRCGSALPNLQMGGELLVVPAGGLDTELKMQPTAHISVASKASWDEEMVSVPVFSELPE